MGMPQEEEYLPTTAGMTEMKWVTAPAKNYRGKLY